jgi:hypothetical protein
MSINSCGINGLASGLRVDGLGSGGSVNFVDLVAVVCAVAGFAFVAVFGFAFCCAVFLTEDLGFALWAVAFFATGFFVVVVFFATGFVFAMIFSLLSH